MQFQIPDIKQENLRRISDSADFVNAPQNECVLFRVFLLASDFRSVLLQSHPI